jgi:hypothetical protein
MLQHTFKLATINISGIMSYTETSLLGEFRWKNDVYVALLQEVTQNNFGSIRGYTSRVNEGTEKRGTAIIIKGGLTTANAKRLPSGRGIAAMYVDT